MEPFRRIPGLASGVAMVGTSTCSLGSLVPVRMVPDSAAAAAATARRRTDLPPGTLALCDLVAGRRLRPLGVPEASGVEVPVARGGVPVVAAAIASMLVKPGAHMEAERPLLWCTAKSTSSAMSRVRYSTDWGAERRVTDDAHVGSHCRTAPSLSLSLLLSCLACNDLNLDVSLVLHNID